MSNESHGPIYIPMCDRLQNGPITELQQGDRGKVNVPERNGKIYFFTSYGKK